MLNNFYEELVCYNSEISRYLSILNEQPNDKKKNNNNNNH